MKFYHVLRPIKIALFSGLILCSFTSAQNVLPQELKLAESYLRAGNFQGALVIYQRHFSAGNDSPQVIEAISRCYKELNLYDDWIAFLKQVIKIHPDIYKYSIDLGSAYYFNKQNELALQTWQEVYTIDPPQIFRYRQVAQTMGEMRLFDEAIAVYNHALKMPNQEQVHLDIGNMYRALLNYEKAVDHYTAYFKKFRNQAQFIRSLIINMAKTDDATERIIHHIEQMDEHKDPDLSELLANLYMRRKNYEKAFKIIIDIEKAQTNKKFEYLNRFAGEAAKDNAFAYVIKTLEYVKKENPQENFSLNYRLAYAHYRHGSNLFKEQNFKEADIHINKALAGLQLLLQSNTAEQFIAAELSGDIYCDHFNDLDKALQYYQNIPANRVGVNNSDRIFLKIAEVYILKNDLQTAGQIFTKIKSSKYIDIAMFNLGELKYFTGQSSRAKKIFSELISKIGMRDSLANNALDRMFDIDRFASDSINFSKYTDAQLLERQHKFSQAASKMEELYYLNKDVSLKAGMNAAEIYGFLDKKAESVKLLEDIIVTHKDAEEIDLAYFMLADKYAEQKDYAKSLALYQEILTRFPTSFKAEQAREKAREINERLQKTINQ